MGGRKLHLLLILTLGLTISCGKKELVTETASDTGANENKLSLKDKEVVTKIIIGDVDWNSADRLTSKKAKANLMSVVRLELPGYAGRCTGFYVAENIVMTNNHCVPASWALRGASAVLEDVDSASSDQVSCNKFYLTSRRYDYTLIGCDSHKQLTPNIVKLSAQKLSAGEALYVGQHNCDYYTDRSCNPEALVSLGEVVRVNGSSVYHNADTLGGSSGSPVFHSRSHMVIGIHHQGHGNRGDGRGYVNLAVKMSDVVSDIQRQLAR